MIFARRFFIALFTGLSTFIIFQIIFRKAYGLDMLTFRDLMNYFSSLSIDKFTFGDAFINFVNSVTDIEFINWQPTDSIVDAISNTFDLLVNFFKWCWGIISTVFDLMVAIVNDLLVVVYFFRDFFGFLFT